MVELPAPSSPQLTSGVRKNPTKRRVEPATSVPAKKTRRETVELDRESDGEDEKKPSEEFPVDERPPMFRDDRKFNRLSFQEAARYCMEYSLLQEKKRMKEKQKNSMEKSDDKIATVSIPAGDDNAGDILNIEARKKWRPVNMELSQQMSWFPSERKEVIRNLPLEVYGLQDTVGTKAIELCHNLASVIKIDMFGLSNARSTNDQKRQKAFTDSEGKLVVESDDVYGELKTTMDVVQALVTLDCIWQKIHPEWPVAKIALRVCFAMKLFAHCGAKSKEVMVDFVNRLLASNASRVANKQGPMSYERAWNLAGNRAVFYEFEREPPVHRVSAAGGRGGGQASGGGQAGAGRGARGGGARGGRGAAATGGRTEHEFVTLPDGSKLCFYYQSNRCHDQKDSQCRRGTNVLKHLCAYKKSGGAICGGTHSKSDHDPAKHGN